MGLYVGLLDGMTVGSVVGFLLGLEVGINDIDGTNVGRLDVGSNDGDFDTGIFVGRDVGEVVGRLLVA